MAQHLSPYAAGYQAGQAAEVSMSAFEMSPYLREFTVGYIVGYSCMQSFRMASQDVAAWSAGELGYRYRISADELLPHLGFDRELTQRLRQAFEDERENDGDCDLD